MPKIAECFLILLFKRMSIYMIGILKRMSGHGGRLHTSLLKSSKFYGVTGALGYDIKVYR